MKLGAVVNLRFVISFVDHKNDDAIGEMTVQKYDTNKVKLCMNPLEPEWAKKYRKMKYLIEWDDKNADIKSEMNN